MFRFTLKVTINNPTCFGLTKPSSGKLRCVLRYRSVYCNFDVNFNILKQFNFASVGQIKCLITPKMQGATEEKIKF
jgi:hypothetical protein